MSTAITRTLSRFRGDTAGAAVVEFAIVANVFIAFVMGIVYVAIMLFNNASLNWAVADAARLASINPAATQSDIAAVINTRLSSFGLSNANVQFAISTLNGLQTAHIGANYQQSYTIPFVSTFHLTFNSDAYVPVSP